MRRYVDVVRLRPVGYLERLGDAADVAQVDARVADELLLDDLAELPLVRPLLARGYGHADVPREGAVAGGVLGAQRVLDEEGVVFLDAAAQVHDVVGVEAGVHVEGYMDVGADGLAYPGNLLLAQEDGLHGVEDARLPRLQHPARLRLSPADELPALLDVFDAPLDQLVGGVALAVGIADDLVTDGAAQQLVDGQAERLALDVPQCYVDAADRAGVDALRGEEVATEHVLPEPLRAERVLSDDQLRQVLDSLGDGLPRQRHAHLAEAVDARVRIDSDEEPAEESRLDGDGGDFGDFHGRLRCMVGGKWW